MKPLKVVEQQSVASIYKDRRNPEPYLNGDTTYKGYNRTPYTINA